MYEYAHSDGVLLLVVHLEVFCTVDQLLRQRVFSLITAIRRKRKLNLSDL